MEPQGQRLHQQQVAADVADPLPTRVVGLAAAGGRSGHARSPVGVDGQGLEAQHVLARLQGLHHPPLAFAGRQGHEHGVDVTGREDVGVLAPRPSHALRGGELLGGG